MRFADVLLVSRRASKGEASKCFNPESVNKTMHLVDMLTAFFQQSPLSVPGNFLSSKRQLGKAELTVNATGERPTCTDKCLVNITVIPISLKTKGNAPIGAMMDHSNECKGNSRYPGSGRNRTPMLSLYHDDPPCAKARRGVGSTRMAL
jgi:hypothetical protein